MANMRKMIEKKRSSTNEISSTSSSSVMFTIIVVLIMLVLAYGASMLIYHFNKKPSTITEVKQYNINASLVFDMNDDEYYVMFYDKTGSDAIVLNALVDEYRKSNQNPIYVVDLSKNYNKSIIGSVPNTTASSSTELQIAGSTLLKIKEGKNDGYFENVLLIEKELD